MSNYMNIVLGMLGLSAFIVNIIVELIKDLPKIKNIPTKLIAIITSAIVNLVSIILAVEFNECQLSIGIILLAIIGAFPVAYISMYGFDTFKELYDRYLIKSIKKDLKDDNNE